MRPSTSVASTFTRPMLKGLQKDLGGRLERAAVADELDRAVQIGLGMRDLLGQRQGITGLDQHMKAPGLDLLALRLWMFDRLCPGLTGFRSVIDEPCLGKLALKRPHGSRSPRSCGSGPAAAPRGRFALPLHRWRSPSAARAGLLPPGASDPRASGVRPRAVARARRAVARGVPRRVWPRRR